MVKKRIALYGIISLTLLLFLFGTYKLMNARTYQLFGGLTSHVETNQKGYRQEFCVM
uniref:Polysaccharide deacetylase n=1 Tax=Geobacillus sp. (strain Y4.1MC1) TaxID=581103 RepID=A0A7U3YEX9_GEOS0